MPGAIARIASVGRKFPDGFTLRICVALELRRIDAGEADMLVAHPHMKAKIDIDGDGIAGTVDINDYRPVVVRGSLGALREHGRGIKQG